MAGAISALVVWIAANYSAIKFAKNYGKNNSRPGWITRMNPNESKCWRCKFKKWAIGAVVEINEKGENVLSDWLWIDECNAGFMPGDQVKECEGFNEAD